MRGVYDQRARPETPPRPTASRSSSTSRVFEQVSPSAPASRAIVASDRTTSRSTSVTNGGSFTNRGLGVRARNASTSASRCASLSPSRPQETFGQLALSSTPSTSGSRSSSDETATATSSSARLTKRGAGPRSRWRKVAATASAPGFGSPIALTMERRRVDRTIRGDGLPARAARVTVPPTTYPNPSSPSASRWRQALSNPAANPIGLRSGTPQSSISSDGSLATPPIRCQGNGSPSIAVATRCEVSGGNEKKSGRPIAGYHPAPRVAIDPIMPSCPPCPTTWWRAWSRRRSYTATSSCPPARARPSTSTSSCS